MDIPHNSNGLSNFVSKEINSLRYDENFYSKSKQVLEMLSEISEDREAFYEASYDDELQRTQNQLFEHKDLSEDYSYLNLLSHNSEDQFPLFSDTLSSQESKINPSEKAANKDIKSESLTNEEDSKPAESGTISSKMNTDTQLKPKSKCPRGTEPVDFLSLKRKDVVFKSIFRMMRRYYCQLLESTTGYNRKEKCLKVKHKDLLKSLLKGMPMLNFSDFAPNMAFYFGAFAYPSDLRKILEESKQQFRTQNEVLSQAMFIVELVDNCFNRFSKKILNDILSVPQFSFLIHYYLENVDDLSEYPKPFQNCFSTLIKSKDHVNNFNEDSYTKMSKCNPFVLKEEFFLFGRSDSL